MSAASIDPELTGEQLQELAAAQPELAPEILNHPNCYPALADWINTYQLVSPASGPAADPATSEDTQLAATMTAATVLNPGGHSPVSPTETTSAALPKKPPKTSLAQTGQPTPRPRSKKNVVLGAALATIIVFLLAAVGFVFLGNNPSGSAGAGNAKSSGPLPADAEAIKDFDLATLPWKIPRYDDQAQKVSNSFETFELCSGPEDDWCSNIENREFYYSKEQSPIAYVDLNGDRRLDAVTESAVLVANAYRWQNLYHVWLWDPESRKPVQQTEPFFTFKTDCTVLRDASFTAGVAHPNSVSIHFSDWHYWNQDKELPGPPEFANTAEDRVFGWKDGKMVQLAGKTGEMTSGIPFSDWRPGD